MFFSWCQVFEIQTHFILDPHLHEDEPKHVWLVATVFMGRVGGYQNIQMNTTSLYMIKRIFSLVIDFLI